MFTLFNKKTNGLLGLDIGSSAIKIVELSRSSDGSYKLENYVIEKFLEVVSYEQQSTVLPETIGNVLQKAMERISTRNRFAVVAVTSASVFEKYIEVDGVLSEFELEEELKTEAIKYIPYSLDEVMIDFEVIKREGSHQNMHVLLVACRNEHIELRQASLELAGLTAKVIEVEIYALERACLLMEAQFSKEDFVVFVDIGAIKAILMVLHEGQVIYVTERQVENNWFVTVVEEFDALPINESIDLDVSMISKEEQDLSKLSSVIVYHISNALQLFFTSSSLTSVDYLVLSGGISLTPHLVSAIEKKIGLPTFVANPFADMSINSRIDKNDLTINAPLLMTACGLAMRGLE